MVQNKSLFGCLEVIIIITITVFIIIIIIIIIITISSVLVVFSAVRQVFDILSMCLMH